MKHFRSLSIAVLCMMTGFTLMSHVDESRLTNAGFIAPPKRETTTAIAKPRPIQKQQRQQINIEFSYAELVYNPQVGNEWSVWIESGGRKYAEGDQFSISKGESMVLYAVDDDPSHDDVGTTRLTINQSMINSGEITESVYVKEYHGRGAGKTAEWEFTLLIKSI